MMLSNQAAVSPGRVSGWPDAAGLTVMTSTGCGAEAASIASLVKARSCRVRVTRMTRKPAARTRTSPPTISFRRRPVPGRKLEAVLSDMEGGFLLDGLRRPAQQAE